MKWIGLIIGDGIPGLWKAAAEVFPEALNQRDWMHKMMNEVSALGLVYQLMLKRQVKWRRINYPELAALVIAGVRYRNGIEIRTRKEIA